MYRLAATAGPCPGARGLRADDFVRGPQPGRRDGGDRVAVARHAGDQAIVHPKVRGDDGAALLGTRRRLHPASRRAAPAARCSIAADSAEPVVPSCRRCQACGSRTALEGSRAIHLSSGGGTRTHNDSVNSRARLPIELPPTVSAGATAGHRGIVATPCLDLCVAVGAKQDALAHLLTGRRQRASDAAMGRRRTTSRRPPGDGTARAPAGGGRTRTAGNSRPASSTSARLTRRRRADDGFDAAEPADGRGHRGRWHEVSV